MKPDGTKKVSDRDPVDQYMLTRPQVFALIADSILEGLYKNGLSSNEYCIVWCERGDRWKESLLGFEYDVVIVDFSLFPNDPISALLAIKKLSPDSEIIVLSDSEDVRIAIAAYRMGITDYFLKPTNPETLSWAVERILRKKAVAVRNHALSSYLEIFGAAHNISVAESDTHMRNIAMKSLTKMLSAEGALWLWGPRRAEEESEPPPVMEFYHESEDHAEKIRKEFLKAFPNVLTESFESDLSKHPDQWFRGNYVWIPLMKSWMGGILLHHTKEETTGALQAQLEFLVRNLEVSLEHHKRLSDAKQLTYIDDLTGLYNSRYLDLALSAAIEDARKNNNGFAVLFIDIDHFKKINDQHGHLVGSQMLVEMGAHLKKTFRKSDLLFRYGGDEFIVMIYQATIPKAMEVAERLRAEVEARRFIVCNLEIKITLSIGVARFPDHGKEKKQIIQMADDAMYSGKRSGRNAVFISGTGNEAAKKVTADK
jgi:diguanylate cyclase (GGDEF)-like protein